MWTLFVYNPDGTFKAEYGPNDQVESIRWSTSGLGDCLDAVITGNLNVLPRDIIGIRARAHESDPPSSARMVYWGWVVTCPNSHYNDVGEYRLIGGAQRLRETVNRRTLIEGGDVAAMALKALHRWFFNTGEVSQMPVGVLPPLTGSFRDTDFQLGDRWSNLESIGDTLDALAEAAPSFVVPTGSTYTYAATYTAGEVVPPVRWGVEATGGFLPSSTPGGRVFFRRRSKISKHTFNDVEDKLTVEFHPISGDVVTDSVIVLFAQEPSPGAIETRSTGGADQPYAPLAYTLDGALDEPYDSWVVVERPTMDVLKQEAWGPGSGVNVINFGNAFDTNVSSYAYNAAGSSFQLIRHTTGRRAAFKVRYSSHLPLWFEAYQIETIFGGAAGDSRIGYRWRLEPTDGEQKDVLFVAPSIGAQYSGQWRARLYGTVTSGGTLADTEPLVEDAARVYDIRNYSLNEEVAEAIARSHLRPVRERVASVTVPHRIVSPIGQAEITVTDVGTFTADVARHEYSITRELGYQTIIHTEQELPAPYQAEKDLLERDRRVRRAPARIGRLT